MSDATRTCGVKCQYNKEGRYCTCYQRPIKNMSIILCSNFEYNGDPNYVYGEEKPKKKKSETDFDTVIEQIEIQMGLRLTEKEVDGICEALDGRFLGDEEEL